MAKKINEETMQKIHYMKTMGYSLNEAREYFGLDIHIQTLFHQYHDFVRNGCVKVRYHKGKYKICLYKYTRLYQVFNTSKELQEFYGLVAPNVDQRLSKIFNIKELTSMRLNGERYRIVFCDKELDPPEQYTGDSKFIEKGENE